MLIWPDSLKLVGSTGHLGVANESGKVLARVGNDVRVGGGQIPSRVANRLAEIPNRCQVRPYWVVTSIHEM
jgi:hypothetical protein